MGRFAVAADSPASRCSFGKYLDSLPEEDRSELDALMARKDRNGRNTWGSRSIIQLIFEVDEVRFARDTIDTHRSGGCLCHETS